MRCAIERGMKGAQHPRKLMPKRDLEGTKYDYRRYCTLTTTPPVRVRCPARAENDPKKSQYCIRDKDNHPLGSMYTNSYTSFSIILMKVTLWWK